MSLYTYEESWKKPMLRVYFDNKIHLEKITDTKDDINPFERNVILKEFCL